MIQILIQLDFLEFQFVWARIISVKDIWLMRHGQSYDNIVSLKLKSWDDVLHSIKELKEQLKEEEAAATKIQRSFRFRGQVQMISSEIPSPNFDIRDLTDRGITQ